MENNYIDKIGSYSCSNVKNINHGTRCSKNFYLMTIEELEQYWEYMDKKFNNEINNKYNEDLEFDEDLDLELEL